jgi:hypothetical protein
MADAATVLNTTTVHLQRICRENGFPRWPGKKVRFDASQKGLQFRVLLFLHSRV